MTFGRCEPPANVKLKNEKGAISSVSEKTPPICGILRLLKVAQFPQGTMSGISHDYVVKDFEFEQLACTDKVSGHLDVRF